MADSAVSFVVGRLAEFAVKEAAVLKEVGSDVVLLKDKLQWLHTFVQQADQRRRRGGNAYMDVWVQQTREVALEVEDVLDKFMLRVDQVHLGGCDIPFTLFTGFILRRLQSLKLFGSIDMTADTADKRCTLPNLTRLELVDSMVNQGFINKIGKLPCLTELVLSKESYDDEGLVFSGGEFSNLTKLVLRGLPRVSEWNIKSESLPSAEKIIVSDCTKMRLKIEGEDEALKNVKEFMVINMADNWPGVEESTGLNERLKRVIIRRSNGPRAPRGGTANMVTAGR